MALRAPSARFPGGRKTHTLQMLLLLLLLLIIIIVITIIHTIIIVNHITMYIYIYTCILYIYTYIHKHVQFHYKRQHGRPPGDWQQTTRRDRRPGKTRYVGTERTSASIYAYQAAPGNACARARLHICSHACVHACVGRAMNR